MSNDQQPTSSVPPVYLDKGKYVLTSILRETEDRLLKRDEEWKLAREGQTLFMERWIAWREMCEKLLKLGENIPWCRDDSYQCADCKAARAVIAEAEAALAQEPKA